MATRAYIVRFLSDTEAELAYNHFDGGDYLNKALNDNNVDPEEVFENPGHIRGISDDGEIERYPDGDLTTIKGEDIIDTIQRVADTKGAVNYFQVYDGLKDEYHQISTNQPLDLIYKEFEDIINPVGDELMNEGWESKWDKFLNENVDKTKLEDFIKSALKDEIDSQVEVYLDSVRRDISRGDLDQYVEMDVDDIIEDFENYIADKLNS
jgi:Zn-dependent M32 family carboxypeptidase